jgi:hypothetical protein
MGLLKSGANKRSTLCPDEMITGSELIQRRSLLTTSFATSRSFLVPHQPPSSLSLSPPHTLVFGREFDQKFDSSLTR